MAEEENANNAESAQVDSACDREVVRDDASNDVADDGFERVMSLGVRLKKPSKPFFGVHVTFEDEQGQTKTVGFGDGGPAKGQPGDPQGEQDEGRLLFEIEVGVRTDRRAS